jgi:redox-sensitive bicupin YhaK (pirin superfamily)
VRLPAGASATVPVDPKHSVFLYLYEGDADVGDDHNALPGRAAGMLGPGDAVRVRAGQAGARMLLLAGAPIGEPVVQYGPFVMNTRDEIDRAIADYQAGRLAAA